MTDHVPAPRVLHAEAVAVRDRRRPLLWPTTLTVRTGEVVLAYGDPGHGHTCLALALAGRLVPDTGAVTLDGAADPSALQRSVALVDVPGVSDPDDDVALTTIVGEELAMARRPAGRAHVRAWLTEQGLAEHTGDRMEDLPTGPREVVLSRLAELRPGVAFLVLTLPERYGGLPEDWLDLARGAAARGYGVLVTVSLGTARQVAADPAAAGLSTVAFGTATAAEPETPVTDPADDSHPEPEPDADIEETER